MRKSADKYDKKIWNRWKKLQEWNASKKFKTKVVEKLKWLEKLQIQQE